MHKLKPKPYLGTDSQPEKAIHVFTPIERLRAAVAVGDGGVGYCENCGAEHFGVEQMANHRPCCECGLRAVFGAKALLRKRGEK
jgi:hypothetical protein